MYTGIHVKYPLLLSDFNRALIFLDRFYKITQVPNFMKICPVEAGLYIADKLVRET
jgi:hypothetical protein